MEKRETTEKPDIRMIVNHSIKTAGEHIQDKINNGDNWTDSYLNTITAIGGYLQMIEGGREKAKEIEALGKKIQEEKVYDQAGLLTDPSVAEKDRLMKLLETFEV